MYVLKLPLEAYLTFVHSETVASHLHALTPRHIAVLVDAERLDQARQLNKLEAEAAYARRQAATQVCGIASEPLVRVLSLDASNDGKKGAIHERSDETEHGFVAGIFERELVDGDTILAGPRLSLCEQQKSCFLLNLVLELHRKYPLKQCPVMLCLYLKDDFRNQLYKGQRGDRFA